MKKTLTLLLASLLVTSSFLASCGKKKNPSSSSSTTSQEITSNVTSQNPVTSSSSSIVPPQSYVEVGEHTLTWINGVGSSYQLVDGGVLPSKANTDDTISFKLALAYGVTVAPTVTINDEELAPIDNVYTFVVKGNTTIKTSNLDINYDEIVEYSSYYLCLGKESFAINEANRLIVDKYPVYSNEQYYIEDIDLEIGDTFKIVNNDDSSVLKNYEKIEGALPTGSLAEDGTFTCTEKGSYAIYIKVTGEETLIYVECYNEREIKITGVEANYTYYVWSWGGDKADTWLPGTLDGTTFTFTLPKRASGFLIAQFEQGLAIEDADWSVKIKQSEDIAPVRGVSSYPVTWKAA